MLVSRDSADSRLIAVPQGLRDAVLSRNVPSEGKTGRDCSLAEGDSVADVCQVCASGFTRTPYVKEQVCKSFLLSRSQDAWREERH